MDHDDTIQRRFLEQLQALEAFRIGFTGQHPGVPLERADPDVQRLLEAQALFSARTQVTAERTLTQGTRRLFAQQLPYLLAPTPATGLLQAELDPRFVDPVALEPGEELGVLEQNVDLEDSPSPVLLRTLAPLPLRPLHLVDVRFERPRPRSEAEVRLQFEASHARRWPVTPLALHVDHLGELQSSAGVHLALRQSLLGAQLRWDGGEPMACPVRFGPIPAGPSTGLDHPLDQVRAFFRLPEMDLFMTFLPPAPPDGWTRFEIRLRLSEAWPPGLGLEASSLRMHVVPVVNLRRELAAPISVDGTRSQFSIDHPDPLGGYVLRETRGAYRLDPAEGLVPLTPGFVPSEPEGEGTASPRWEVETRGQGGQRRGTLRLAAPEALVEPFRLSVDGLWHQPNRAAEVPDGAEAHLLHRGLDGVGFRTGRLRPALEGRLAQDDEALLSLLGARNRRTLSLADLRTLLDVLRGPDERAFEPLVRAITEVDVRSVPSARAAGGFRYRYRIKVEGSGAEEVPLLVLFGHRIRQTLAAWSTEDVVELELDLPRMDRRLGFRGDEGAAP